jgi:hypothetical protein
VPIDTSPVLSTADLASWLIAQGITADIGFDGQAWVEILPDQAVLLTLMGGGPELFERTFDTPSVQLLSRGGQMDPTSAEALAWSIDNLLLGAVPPIDIGSTRVIAIERVGGPPRFVQYDAARRRIFSATYIFTAARTIF